MEILGLQFSRVLSLSLLATAVGGLTTSLACTMPESGETADGDSTGETGDSAGDTDGTETADTEDTSQELVTWHQDIAPLMAEKCSGCHREGGIGPFALADYEDGSNWAELALAAIESGAMPPWAEDTTDECQTRHGFLGDPRLSDDQVAQLQQWIADDKPEGDPATAAPLPSPPNVHLDTVDQHLVADGNIEIGGSDDQFWCYVLDPGFDTTTFIDGVEVIAGNEKIVHHVLVYLDESGESEALGGEDGRYECFGGPGVGSSTLLAAWAPGVPAQEYPPQVASSIPAGSRLVMNVHYHPTGETEIDEGTGVDLRYASSAPLYLGQMALIGNFDGPLGNGMGLLSGDGDSDDSPEFVIPAGATDHRETMLYRLPDQLPEVKIWQAGTHMHYVGTDMLISVDRAEPEEGTGIDQECLIQTPRYDFNWQRGYRYDAKFEDVPTVKAGDVLHMRCDYNNSMSNPYVVEALAAQGLDEPTDVLLGDETLDEMCLGVFGIAYSLVP